MGEHTMSIVTVAIVVVIVAVLAVAVFALVNTGQGLLSTGKGQINESLKNYSEVSYTQYDGAVVSGTQVISEIKNNWKGSNTVSVTVCTKDGYNINYDYSGTNWAMIASASDEDGKAIKSNFPSDSKGAALTTNGTAGAAGALISYTASTNSSTVQVGNKNAGYDAGSSTSAHGYISRNANFSGTIHRDRNGNVRMITFVQE